MRHQSQDYVIFVFNSVFFLQSISPGVVETEFASRLYSNNADKAAAVYARFKVTLLILFPKNVCNYYKCLLINLIHCFRFLQPLEAIDVTSAVIYALSSPPHVQVCGFFKHKRFCLVKDLLLLLLLFSSNMR